jgi:protein-tyrosine phosphatase
VGPVGASAARSRALAWDGCSNVRDLGGLQTASGRRTRHGAVVRADNVRRLTPAGWEAALRHGVRRLVDLRFEGEGPGEPSPPAEVEVVGVSLFGRHDPEAERAFDARVRDAEDVAAVFAAGYIKTLARSPGRVAAAVAAVADADHRHGVLIHCFAGKDRTGIVSALVLGVADVPDEVVIADYAQSDDNMSVLFGGWIGSAKSPSELELRRRLVRAPAEAMAGVLTWLRTTAGGATPYLRAAGLADDQIARLRARLLESP